MVQNDGPGPSGSRWEPTPQPLGSMDAHPRRSAPSAPSGPAPTASRRRHRRPVVAVLLTLLGAGAVTAGAAYTQGDGAPSASPTSQVAGSGERDGRHRPDGDHGDGHRPAQRTTDDQAGPSGAGS
jgi:hypothetical protein